MPYRLEITLKSDLFDAEQNRLLMTKLQSNATEEEITEFKEKQVKERTAFELEQALQVLEFRRQKLSEFNDLNSKEELAALDVTITALQVKLE